MLKITHVDTLSAPVSDRLEYSEETGCAHCLAAYGHKVFCPLINRETAEAWSAFNGNASEADRIAAHGLGIKLGEI